MVYAATCNTKLPLVAAGFAAGGVAAGALRPSSNASARAPSSVRVSGLAAGLGSGLGSGLAAGLGSGLDGCAAADVVGVVPAGGTCGWAVITGGGTETTGGGVGMVPVGSAGAAAPDVWPAPCADATGGATCGSLTWGWNGVLRSGTLMGILSATGTGWESSTMGSTMTAARTSAIAPASLRRARPRNSAACTSLGTAARLEDCAWSAGSLRLKNPWKRIPCGAFRRTARRLAATLPMNRI